MPRHLTMLLAASGPEGELASAGPDAKEEAGPRPRSNRDEADKDPKYEWRPLYLTGANQMSTFYKLYPTTTIDEFSVFRCLNSDGQLVLRTLYHDLACVRCGKIDELAALNRGIPDALLPNTKLDVFETVDHLLIISARTKIVVDDTCLTDIVLYPFSSTDQFHIVMPRTLLHPIDNDSAFRVTDKCRECKRYREVVWGPDAPKLVEDKQVFAYQLESRLGSMPSWIVSQAIVRALKGQKPKLKGFIFIPV